MWIDCITPGSGNRVREFERRKKMTKTELIEKVIFEDKMKIMMQKYNLIKSLVQQILEECNLKMTKYNYQIARDILIYYRFE